MRMIYIDADACPVKDEVYRVARRYSMPVVVVAKASMHVPIDALFQLEVRPGFGEVDEWIAATAGVGDLVITADIPLASRALEANALVLDPRGEAFTENDIGSALAMRELMSELRQTGEVTGGPRAMSPKDRSRFLSKLDEMVNALRRSHPPLK